VHCPPRRRRSQLLNPFFGRLLLELDEHSGHRDGDPILYATTLADTTFREGTAGTHTSLACTGLAYIIAGVGIEGDWGNTGAVKGKVGSGIKKAGVDTRMKAAEGETGMKGGVECCLEMTKVEAGVMTGQFESSSQTPSE
jgi:hypothetical protein